MKNKKLILIFVLPLLLFVLYYGVIDERLYPVIDCQIYRSAQLSAPKLTKEIKTKHIKTIINLRGVHKNEKWYHLEKEIAIKNNVKLYSISMPDHDLPKYRELNRLIDILLTAERPLLIHCRRGADRAGMASALTLVIDKDLPLSQIKKQFSWRYGVVPFLGSIGPRLFSKYEAFLTGNRKEHSRSRLLYWIKNVYVDQQHNMEFWIDSANDQQFAYGKDYKVTVKKSLNPIFIKGWAYDAQKKAVPNNFFVALGEQISARVNYKFYRPNVEEYLGFDVKAQRKYILGWEVNINSDNLIKKCYPMSIKFVREKPPGHRVPTKYQLCIN